MPYMYMPCDEPERAATFFQDLVDDGSLKVIRADERPDVWEEVHPCDDYRLILGTKDTVVPEDVDIAVTLDAFSPEPDAATQFKAWTQKPESEPQEVPPAATDASSAPLNPESEAVEPATLTVDSAPVEDVPPVTEQAAMDKWTPLTSRGFKG